jgi:alkanesulfonate monooxygenase SsuD/methylene tetrahydromethanopterin reductase-like flavin-dependent oxidoreductase (luciferase family)
LKFGVTLPNLGVRCDARTLAELAHQAEQSGWDGVFVWDSLYQDLQDPRYQDVYDPWITLSAIAMRTERVRIGTMVTPIARRRPWKLARETVTLDYLSNGRLTLPVGLGAVGHRAFSALGEASDRKTRAKMLDEGLNVLTGLWTGKPYTFNGQFYHVDDVTFLPKPLQQPRIPIWVAAAWPREKSMDRAIRFDGILPAKMSSDGSQNHMKPADIREMKEFISKNRGTTTTYDIVMEGHSSGDDPDKAFEKVGPYADAGVTWWLEAVWDTPDGFAGPDQILERIKQGPPKLGSVLSVSANS